MSFATLNYLKNQCLKQANSILKAGRFSEAAIEKAIDTVVSFSDKLYAVISKFSGYKGFDKLTTDTTPMSVVAESLSDSFGTDTFTSSTVNLGLIDTGRVSIAVGTAQSYAVGTGDNAFAVASTFTQVRGADFAVTQTLNFTGNNFQKSSQFLFAVDFEYINDLYGIALAKQTNIVTNAMDPSEIHGNTAIAQFDVRAYGEDSFTSGFAETVAIEDALSSSLVSTIAALG